MGASSGEGEREGVRGGVAVESVVGDGGRHSWRRPGKDRLSFPSCYSEVFGNSNWSYVQRERGITKIHMKCIYDLRVMLVQV